MKRTLPAVAGVACLLMLCPALSAGEAGLRPVSLMKGWTVKTVEDLKELGDKFARPDFDDAAWDKIDVQDKEDPYQARYVLYRKWFELPPAWKGKKVSVVFGGVDDDAVVYVNGQKLAEHKGWNTEFAADLSAVAKWDGKNLLAVVADNSGGGGAGIWRPVSLALTEEVGKAKEAEDAALRAELKKLPFKIIYETWQDTNWELFLVNPDGSDPVNLTKTPNLNELYPHASPDGSKVCFVADEGTGDTAVRNVYYMNIDGTGRTLVEKNARESCWTGDGSGIVYLKGEFDKFTPLDYATKGIFIYDLKTGARREHPNKGIHHLYNIAASPDGNWFVSTVHAGMGFKHAILAIEGNGMRVFDLKLGGCRPDLSPDGRRIAWGASDWALRVADLDFGGPEPKVTNARDVATSPEPMEIYHVDWSPDGKYVAFSRGPKKKKLGFAPEMIGIQAEDWNLCVGDASAKNRWVTITTDGKCNKEPDWVPVRREAK